MSWHYLLGQEEASWVESSLDGAPSALLRLMPTPEASSSPDSATGALNPSQSGTMLSPSTETRGAATSMSSVADSPARTSAKQNRMHKDLTVKGADSGVVPGVPTGCGRWREMGQPGLVREDDGLAVILDRLHCIGNGQVPGVAALAWRSLGGNP
jgi:hypothetical protein